MSSLTIVKKVTKESQSGNIAKFTRNVKTTKLFTNADLDIHRKAHNPDSHPEYYLGFENMGFEYVKTILVKKGKINPLIESGMIQKYRPGGNPHYKQIKSKMLDVGYDLRERPIMVIQNCNGKFINLFSGNTVNNILNDISDLDNRIVAIFKTNKYYDAANDIAQGVRMNSLAYPSSVNDIDSIKKSLYCMVAAGKFRLEDDTTQSAITLAEEIKDYIKYMMNSDNIVNVGSTKIDKIINDIVNKQTKNISVVCSTNSIDVLTTLRKENPGQYQDSIGDYLWGSYNRVEKIFEHFMIVWNKNHKTYKNFSNGRSYNLIAHLNTPDPTRAIDHFFKFYLNDWYYPFLQMWEISKPTGLDWVILKGAYQCVSAFKNLWPLYTVVPFDEIEIVYEYYQKEGKLPSDRSIFK